MTLEDARLIGASDVAWRRVTEYVAWRRVAG